MGETEITRILIHFDEGLSALREKIDKKIDEVKDELKSCQQKREEFHKELQPIVDDATHHTGCAKSRKLRREKILDQCKGALIMLAIAVMLKYFWGIVV
jgi:uncharacterized coiled-coil DUF342 family protein